jgi:excisionase family DNA binding protein
MDVLTPVQLARELGVKPDKVRGWIKTGQLKAANVGDASRPRFRIRRIDFNEFWERRCAPEPAACSQAASLSESTCSALDEFFPNNQWRT